VYVTFHVKSNFPNIVLRGVAGLAFCADEISGIFILVGMLFCSRISPLFAIFGSMVGVFVAVLIGADSSQISAGLWSYNSALTAVATGGMLIVLNYGGFLLSLFSTVLSVLIFAALQTLAMPYGISSLTMGFNLATLGALLLQNRKGITLVKVEEISTPERHISLSWVSDWLQKQHLGISRPITVEEAV